MTLWALLVGYAEGLMGRRGLLVGVLLAGGCSPLVRFEGEVRIAGVEVPVAERLHMLVRVDVNSFNLEKGPERRVSKEGDLTPKLTVEGDVIRYEFGVGGSKAEADVQFWYDSNGDELRDEGDRAGRLPEPVVGKAGLLSSMNGLGEVVLEEAPGVGWVEWPGVSSERL